MKLLSIIILLCQSCTVIRINDKVIKIEKRKEKVDTTDTERARLIRHHLEQIKKL